MKKLIMKAPLSGLRFLLFFCLSIFSTHNLFAVCPCVDPPSPPNCPALDCPVQLTAPCATPTGSTYILRYNVIGERGALTFIGNTLGLSKDECTNTPGAFDAIGAFTTVDASMVIPTWPNAAGFGAPGGTTCDWRENSSSALLNLPPGSTILYAELVWSGSYGYYCSDPAGGIDPIGVDPDCILDFASGPITFITPDSMTHMVIADPATALISQNPAGDVQPLYCGGNYMRSRNVTDILTALPNHNGTYIVGGVPATVSPLDVTHNAAGWTLCIAYRDPGSAFVNNMTIFVSNHQANRPPPAPQTPVEVSGFCTPPIGTGNARLLVSAIESDENKMGDQMTFGPTAGTMVPLSGPNNLITNFFACQINNDTGNLITTSGTYCDRNQTGAVSSARQGYDITNVDCTLTLVPNQTSAFALGTTQGDDYMINALGIQIAVVAPVIVPTKRVNNQLSYEAQIGETVTFTFMINNTGNADAINVFFQDVLEPGLMFVPNSFKVNNVVNPAVTQAQLDSSPGVLIAASVPIGGIVNVEFQATVTAPPLVGDTFFNHATDRFEYTACEAVGPVVTFVDSNIVTITLPENPPPTNFNGRLKKCPMLNKTVYFLRATWDPVPLPTVVSYLILRNGVVVDTVPAAGPFIFETYVEHKSEANQFSIVAQYQNGTQSAPLNIRIL